MKITILDRILLFLTSLLAAYQIAVGIDGLSIFPQIAYSTAFGVIMVSGLLLLIIGFEVSDSPSVVVISTVIPLSLSTGLVWQHNLSFRIAYLIFAIIGFFAILLTRIIPFKNKIPLIVLVIVHSLAGLTIFLLPLILVVSNQVLPSFLLISIGGTLIGLGGLLLALLKAGKPLLSRETISRILPALLLLMTAAFVAGLKLG